MAIINNLEFIGEDRRKRKYLLPKKITVQSGTIRNPESLMKQKPVQIGLNEPDVTTLVNKDGEHSYIVLDFGREIHGGIKLLSAFIRGERFPVVRITFGESVSEAMSEIGQKNATNDHAIRDLTVPLSFLSDQEYGQTGFRFVKIELLSENTEVDFKSILAVMIYTELDYIGSFECSDELINKIYDTAAYTCHLNIQNMVWDGIKRDRLVWIGDMHPETKTICSVFGRVKALEDSLEFVRDQTPVTTYMNGIPSYSMWWLLILYELYMQNGYTDFLERQHEYAAELIRRLCSLVNDDGSDNIENYFFDWPSSGIEGQSSGVRAILRMAFRSGAVLMGVYGENEVMELCYDTIAKLDKQQEDPHELKQAAAFLALSGISDAKTTAEQKLIPGGAHGMSTFLAYYILKAVSDGGYINEAIDMLKEYYGAMIELGATTFWEDFDLEWIGDGASPIDVPVVAGDNDIHGDHGAFCYDKFRHSLCHGWSSGPVPFLAECVLGIEILEPKCRKIRVKPQLAALSFAKGTYPTPYGKIEISHTKEADGTIKTIINAPAEIEIVR